MTQIQNLLGRGEKDKETDEAPAQRAKVARVHSAKEVEPEDAGKIEEFVLKRLKST